MSHSRPTAAPTRQVRDSTRRNPSPQRCYASSQPRPGCGSTAAATVATICVPWPRGWRLPTARSASWDPRAICSGRWLPFGRKIGGKWFAVLFWTGGGSVSQFPLKDKAFLTFLGQNPPIELRLKTGASGNTSIERERHDQIESCSRKILSAVRDPRVRLDNSRATNV
jgi:hypothetical protein